MNAEKLTSDQLNVLHSTVNTVMQTFPKWRKGQTYFNVLYQLHPVLADEIRGTENDPFYQDEKLGQFFDYITDNFDSNKELGLRQGYDY